MEENVFLGEKRACHRILWGFYFFIFFSQYVMYQRPNITYTGAREINRRGFVLPFHTGEREDGGLHTEVMGGG